METETKLIAFRCPIKIYKELEKQEKELKRSRTEILKRGLCKELGVQYIPEKFIIKKKPNNGTNTSDNRSVI